MVATGLLRRLGVTSVSEIGIEKNGRWVCWVGPWGRTTAGYAVYKHEYVHRVAYAWKHGEIPEYHEVHHRCHTRACFRPSHLKALISSDHRGEHLVGSCRRGHPYPESKRPGRNDCAICHREREARRHAAQSHLLRERVVAVRAAVAAGQSENEVAHLFGVTPSTVRRYVRREVYADIH